MTRNFKTRIERLENRLDTITIIYYRECEETFEQRKLRFRKEEGRELPDNAIIICYRRLDIKKTDTPIALKRPDSTDSTKGHGGDRTVNK